MSFSQVVHADALRSLSSGSISGTYATVGTAFQRPMRIVKIVNNTNGDLTISYDGGTTDNDFIPAGGFTLYDATTNRVSNQVTFIFVRGTQISVKGTPSTGSVYVIAFYGQGE